MKIKVLKGKQGKTVGDLGWGAWFTTDFDIHKNPVPKNHIWIVTDANGEEKDTTVVIRVDDGYSHDCPDNTPVLELEPVELEFRIKE